MTLILFLYLYCYLWTEIISGFGVFHAESKHVFLNRVWPIDKLITLQGNHYSVGLLKTDLFWTDFSTKYQTIPLWTKTTITKKKQLAVLPLWERYRPSKDSIGFYGEIQATSVTWSFTKWEKFVDNN